MTFVAPTVSDYEAEANDIGASLRHIANIFTHKVKQRNHIIIFSAPKSGLEALRNEDLNEQGIRKSRTISNFITTHDANKQASSPNKVLNAYTSLTVNTAKQRGRLVG